ncbi:hypothetical protein [Zhongshania marina]|uniref:Uncharacterized protein n=1 Tax=Zhongshania marina TaxID=2304603 RepID=A0A2S4HC15_9GAMM|nr:hypothetical protein [Marortus luteolus]POP51497.1 hypothetical protein C0068_16285 [Marortus luteolus]
MGTYFTSSKFSSCEVGGFVATALIHDLRVNNFTFTNFPEVDIQWDDYNFHITLKAHGASSSTFSLNYATVKSEVSLFREKKEVSKETFEIIQKHAAELEGAVSKT